MLYFKESTNEACPFRFVDLCRVEGFEQQVWDGETEEISLIGCPETSYPNLSNAKFRRPDDVVLPPYKLLALWRRSYQLLRLRPETQNTLDALNVGCDSIGVHIRMTDNVTQTKTAPWLIRTEEIPVIESHLLDLIKREMRRRRCARIFIASDNEESKMQWKRILDKEGAIVLTHSAHYRKDRLRQTSGEDFVIELFALAKCGVVIGATRSGVMRTAVWMSGKRRWLSAQERSLTYLFRYCRFYLSRFLTKFLTRPV
jgi:hypothetical protein